MRILHINYRYGSGCQTTNDTIEMQEGESDKQALSRWKDDNPQHAIWVESYKVLDSHPVNDISSRGGQVNPINTVDYNPN